MFAHVHTVKKFDKERENLKRMKTNKEEREKMKVRKYLRGGRKNFAKFIKKVFFSYHGTSLNVVTTFYVTEFNVTPLDVTKLKVKYSRSRLM